MLIAAAGPTGMKYGIFVSYRRSDREFVAQLVQRLEQAGVKTWYDAQIEGGADWRDEIVDALSQSSLLVVVFSEDSNNSKQLKKELAVADTLEKPIVPVLIEDTKPRGGYLYELADRNWLQAFPNPTDKLDKLVAQLLALVGKTETETAPPAAAQPAAPPPPAPAAPAPAAAQAPEPVERQAEVAASAPTPAAAAPAPADKKSGSAFDEAISAASGAIFGHGDDVKTRAAEYIGKKHEREKDIPTRDILPFRPIDLLFLGPLVVAFGWWLWRDKVFNDAATPAMAPVGITLMCIALIDLYGALVFPFRYYLRHRPVGIALQKYMISAFILYVAMQVIFLVAKYANLLTENDKPLEFAVVIGGVWLIFTAVAFVIYAILSAQRLLSSFRSNIKKL